MEVEQVTERLIDKNSCKTCQRSFCLDYGCEERANYEYACMKKLAKYETAEEEGRLVIFPCKIETPVFQISYTLNYGKIGDKAKINYFISQKRFDYNDIYRLGKTVFLTREKAEKALEKLENVEEIL